LYSLSLSLYHPPRLSIISTYTTTTTIVIIIVVSMSSYNVHNILVEIQVESINTAIHRKQSRVMAATTRRGEFDEEKEEINLISPLSHFCMYLEQKNNLFLVSSIFNQ
jgi:hypothetical protein